MTAPPHPGLRSREQGYLFTCHELGIQASDPDFIPLYLAKYMTAMTYAVDLPESQRDLYVDIGCGSGYGTELLGTFFRSSCGIDRDPQAIGYASLMHRRAGTVYLLSRDMKTDHFYEAVDYITLIEVLEHVPQEVTAGLFAEITSWLKPSGIFFMTTPVATTKDGLNPNNPWHVHEYQPAELRELLAGHFKSVEIRDCGPFNMTAFCREPRK